MRDIRSGLFIVATLWLSVLVATAAFWQADVIAGASFSLCLTWIAVAFALNLSDWIRNPQTA